MARRLRSHNEYFRPFNVRTLYRNNIGSNAPYKLFKGVESSRKTCPTCKTKLEPNEFCWTWGEYHHGKFSVVHRFCKACFQTEIVTPLLNHIQSCGCGVNLVIQNKYGVPEPKWLILPETKCELQNAETTETN